MKTTRTWILSATRTRCRRIIARERLKRARTIAPRWILTAYYQAPAADLVPVAGADPGAIGPESAGYEDQGAPAIVAPGGPGGMDPGGNQVEPADPAPDGSVGQTTHRQDDRPINIEPKQGEQKATDEITPSDLENGSTSV